MKLGLRALEKYVPSDLVRVLLSQTSEVELGGKIKNLSIMFTDIEGFTSISEQMQPMEITNYLADYLDIMSTIIRKYHGTVDKYIGDAVMAFWGAPLNVDNQELAACDAALLCKQSIEELDVMNPDRPPFRTRFGINAGEVLVGNIGSNNRFNYTIIGDHVNVASRLEAINKVYGTSIIISRFVWDKVNTVMFTRKLDLVAVKGKSQPIEIYELLGRKDEVIAKDILDATALHEQALEQYLRQNFAAALAAFQQGHQRYPFMKSFALFADRCESFLQTPPQKDWKGEWVMKTK